MDVIRIDDDALARELVEHLLRVRATRHVVAAAVGEELDLPVSHYDFACSRDVTAGEQA